MHWTILLADNRYSTTHYFARSLAASLRRAGMQTTTLHVRQGGICELLDLLSQLQPDATISFSDISCAGRGLQQITQIPHFSYFLDPAVYFLHQITGAVSCCDEADVALVQAAGGQNVSFLPAAIDLLPKTPAPLSARTFDCVYFGTCFDADAQQARWQGRYGAHMAELLEHLADVVLTTPLSTWQVLREALVPEEQFLTLFHELDHYIRAKDRLQLLSAIDPKKITIWGDGPWSKYFPQATCFPAVDCDQMLLLMSDAKFVLNSSPRFKHGIHERVFFAFMAGAVPMSSFSPPLAVDYTDAITYQPACWDAIPDQLNTLQKQYESLVTHGQQVTFAKHHWDQRVCSLLKQLHCGQRVND